MTIENVTKLTTSSKKNTMKYNRCFIEFAAAYRKIRMSFALEMLRKVSVKISKKLMADT